MAEKYIHRNLEKVIKEVAKDYACLLLCGPRQVGKSTLLEHIDPNRKKVTLDDIEKRNLARTDPKLFLELHPYPILIDEIQYAPELFPYIKMRIDEGIPAGSYFLTGSQSFNLMRLAGESLAGRVAVLHLSGLAQNEVFAEKRPAKFKIAIDDLMKRAKLFEKAGIESIYQRIFNGSMPGHISGKFKNREVFYSSYVSTYIQRDVRNEIAGLREEVFFDFIRSVACRAAQTLNVHSIAVDVGINDDTAKRWLRILERAEIIFFLHPYSNNLLKRTVKFPKMYFFDTGLIAHLTKHSTPSILMNAAINGAILENYVVSELRKEYLNRGIFEIPMYYYRDKDGKEIDIVIEEDGKLYPIEIKKAYSVNKSMVKSFDVLKKAELELGTGAIICLQEEIGALDSETLLIPAGII